MPIITCSDCNNEMSDAAVTCPKCGKPNQTTQASQTPHPDETRKVSILLAIGILFMPFIFSWFTLRKGHSTLSRVVSLSWALIAILITMSGDNKPSSNHSSSSSNSPSSTYVSAPAKPKQRAMYVNINDILSAYKNNEVAADDKYKNKYIKITGYVNSVKKGLFGGRYITVGTRKKFEFRKIQASFDSSQNSVLTKLKKGQRVTVFGKVSGLMGNVQMEKCTIK